MAQVQKKVIQKKPSESTLERLSIKATEWVGTTKSIVVHTIFFIVIFSLYYFGFNINSILLILTTAVSLEAIYLALFIQMTVNRNTESLEDVGEDIEEIQEDVQGLEEDFEEVQEDVQDLEGNLKKIHTNMKGLEEDVEDISEDIDKYYSEEKEKSEEETTHLQSNRSLRNIEKELITLSSGLLALRDDLEILKKNIK
jgi:uncharacterized protein YoxC